LSCVSIKWFNLIGVGRVYRQPSIETYAKASFTKLHDCKTPIMAPVRNGRVLPFHAENGALPPRVLADPGNEQRGTHANANSPSPSRTSSLPTPAIPP
jgi:hypothetical protein